MSGTNLTAIESDVREEDILDAKSDGSPSPLTPDAAKQPEPAIGNRGFIAPLTSLRFFAAMAVVLFHAGSSWAEEHNAVPAPIITLLKNGYLGVTFFFVLSGFILQHVYRATLSTRVQLRDFAIARFARIYPLYILALLFTALFEFHASWRAIPQLFLLQWWTPTRTPPFENWNMPAWTLSVELMFYFVFPLLGRCAAKAGPISLSLLAVGICIFELLVGSSTLGSEVAFPWLAWLPLPLLRLPEFVLGILTAEAIVRRRGERPIAIIYVVILLGIALSIFNSPTLAGVVTLLSAILIYCATLDRSSGFARLLAQPALVYFGGASYAIYVLQQPVHMALDKIGSPPVLYYPVLVGLSAVIFRYYEEPTRRTFKLLFARGNSRRPDTSLPRGR